MGTSTATYFTNKVKTNSLAGIIIAGTVRTASLDDDVKFPVMAIYHSNDQCAGTPLSASENIISSRPKNTVSRMEIIEGRISEGNVCVIPLRIMGLTKLSQSLFSAPPNLF